MQLQMEMHVHNAGTIADADAELAVLKCTKSRVYSTDGELPSAASGVSHKLDG